MREVTPSRLVKNKIENKYSPYTIYVHTTDSSGAELGQFVTHVPSIKDSMLLGMFTLVDTNEVNQYYYQKLKRKCGDDFCKTKIANVHTTANLNQLHVYIEDTAKSSLYKPYGINVNTTKRVEKVKRFDKRWLWLFVGVPLSTLVILFLFAAATISHNIGKIG